MTFVRRDRYTPAVVHEQTDRAGLLVVLGK